ncbi:unnamed protein product [Rotaria sordida]|uniref:Pentapeptide repeat-containing protein n=2 Tax=Rotaria sordida TaxID=392033 RepID=A0A814JS15_9BILA|nr:unnamed protein product [Rotaria sordida]
MKLQSTPILFTLILIAIQAVVDPHPFICEKRQSSLSTSSSKYAQTVVGRGPRGPLSASWDIGVQITLNNVSQCPVDLPLNESKAKCNTGLATLMLTIQNTTDAKENRKKDLDIAQREREQTGYLADEERQDNRLAEYLNDISTLMFSNQTLDPLLRAKTMSVLRQVDVKRKREIILFLYEAKLIRTDINSGIPIISLEDVNLDNVDFNDLRSPYTQLTSNFYYHTHMALRGVSLRNASFQRRTLYRSDFAQTDCTHADFSSVDLLDVDFSYAKLVECNFENARFDSTNLQNANLSQSNITDEQLATALTYQGAILPNGTVAKNKNLLINDECINDRCKNLSGTYWIVENGSVVMQLLNDNCYFVSYDSKLSRIHQRIDLHGYLPWIHRNRTVYLFNSELSTNGTELEKQTICQQADNRFCDENSKMCINGICSFDDELDTTNGKNIEITNEDETDRENLITASPILKSNENKNVEAILGSYQKRKKGMFNPQWLLSPQFASFLREYKPDSAKVLCIASNEHFSVQDGGKNNIDRHIKLKDTTTT